MFKVGLQIKNKEGVVLSTQFTHENAVILLKGLREKNPKDSFYISNVLLYVDGHHRFLISDQEVF